MSGEPAALTVLNVDGPGVSLLVDDQVVVAVPCGASATVMPNEELPKLPWNLAVRADNGEVIGSLSLEGLPEWVVVRGRSILVGRSPSYGPAPSLLASPCAAPP